MKIEQLATELRERQYKKGLVERHSLDSLPDALIIHCYTTCSCCGEEQLKGKELASVIELAQDVEHFFQLCDEMSTYHQHQTKN